VLRSLQGYLRKHPLFRPGERVGVAVSGGADSVALLRGLLELRSELGLVLSVVHVHHGIRGAEADADEQFVVRLAAEFDLPLHSERVDVPEHRRREKLSIETAARELRYAFFKRLLESGSCDKIATAHTLDDQAETVLLRILRGTGTRGLAAIPPFRNASPELVARIVRPLLSTRREQIEGYLRSLQQAWCEDASNQDPKHLRNRIRHELLPLLEAEYNPALRQSLGNLAEIARAEEEVWSAERGQLESAVLTRSEQAISVDLQRFTASFLALRRRFLVLLADSIDLPVTFDDIELMLHIADHPGTGHEFESGWCVRSTKKELEIRKAVSQPPSATYDVELLVPGMVELPNGLTLRTSVVAAKEAAGHDPATLLAYARLQLPMRVRNWQPGDRFWPVGSKGPEKLKRLFLERHIPAEARSSWPVVLSGDEIAWVKGFAVAAEFEARDSEAVLIEVVEAG
jgi:tRNA(Ile)-lysidine synthase